jgi:hypothetical protein
MNALSMTSKSDDRRFWVGAALCAAVTIAVIWAPFGFAMGGLIEEWDLLGLATRGTNLWWISPSSALATISTRPLSAFPFALAHFLSPNSFIAWHILTIIELMVKGVAVAYLMRQAICSNLLAVLGGVIAIVFPADTMTIALRGLHINFAMMLVLAGASLNVADLTSERARHLLSVLGAVLALAAFLIYEAAVSLIILPLMVVFIRSGIKGTLQNLRARAGSHAIWLVSASSYVAYFVIITRYTPKSYQASIYRSTTDTPETVLSALKAVFTIAYPRMLWDGWRDGVSMLLVELNLRTAVPLLFGVATVIWLVAWRSRAASDTRSGRLVRALIAGLIIMIAGYAPFALLPSHQAISQRTFLWAAIGASFFTVGALGFLARRQRLITAYLAFLAFMLPSLAFMLVQHDHYVELSDNSRRALRGILAQVDPAKTNVVIDKTNSIGHTWNLLDGTMQLAITYLRDTAQDNYLFHVCRAAGMEWERSFPLGRHGECHEESADWRFVAPVPVSGPGISTAISSEDLVLPDDQVQIITVDPVPPTIETVVNHDPTTPASRERITNILAIKPPSQLWRSLKSDHGDFLRWSFGDWWSLDKPTPGSGWREAEWDYYRSGSHTSSAWANRDEAVIDFQFHPIKPSYPFRIRFSSFINRTVPNQFGVFINGRNIDLMASDGIYSGVIPPSVLRDGTNEFRFKAPVDPQNYGLSATVDGFEIGEPTSPIKLTHGLLAHGQF